MTSPATRPLHVHLCRLEERSRSRDIRPVATCKPVPRLKGINVNEHAHLKSGSRAMPDAGHGRMARDEDLPSSTAIERHVRRALGEGRRLDAPVQSYLERGLGADLSEVHVHTDAASDHLAAMLGADAFTVGSDIFFRAGAYNPGAVAGMRLLAHEAAHTVQQAGMRVSGPAHDVRISDPGDTDERAAARIAERVLQGRPADRRTAHAGARRLQPDEAVVIQRHSSWEHRLLGDAPTANLNSIAHNFNDRAELLSVLRDFLAMWKVDPDSVTEARIKAVYPEIRTLKLAGSGLIVTYGELNTLPDYLARPGDMNTLSREIVFPILQAVRQEGYYNVNRLLGIDETFVKFAGALATHLSNGTINDIWESLWLDSLTANLPSGGSARQGTDAYSGLLARNACHFAPFSWYRWSQAYDRALEAAQKYHKTGNPADQQEAWIQHGYADHFLHDSFAAGHLINKTLVMQWFVDWAAPQTFVRVPDWTQVQTMTAGRQPGLAAYGLYTPANPGSVRDPQTAEEQVLRGARMDMSGVRSDGTIFQEAAYQNYLTFLNNSVIQSSPLALHDYLNKTGLFVASQDHPTPFLLYGDGHMLDGGDGVEIASDTAHMSQQSIQDVLLNGVTKITKDRIQSRFPTRGRDEAGNMRPLQQWAESMVGRAHLVFNDVHDKVIGTVKPHMGHVSMDQGATYLLKISSSSKQGYLGSTNGHWGWLKDKDGAVKLKMVYDGAVFLTTEDGWWLSVGTVGVNKGYVGFYYQQNRGAWEYDAAAKRLKSKVNDAVMSMQRGDDYIYCWPDYETVDVEIESVEAPAA
jgi:hypothetical protein